MPATTMASMFSSWVLPSSSMKVPLGPGYWSPSAPNAGAPPMSVAITATTAISRDDRRPRLFPLERPEHGDKNRPAIR